MGKICLVLAAIAASISCNRGRTESASGINSDTLAIDDTTACDSILTDEQEDEGLSFENRSTEVFGDFIFAFTHNTRFQAERIRFPLPVTDIDGTERTIKSGRQFRSEFRLPHNDYYTLLLGDQRQLDIVQSDTALVNVSLQIIRLHQLTMDCYNFQRSEGRWYLMNRTESHVLPHLVDFFHFYDQFSTDTIFQQESLAPQLKYTMDDPEDDEADIEGTIDSGQWPAFRPEMPHGEFVNIDFGQSYPNPRRIYLFQCGISNGMLDIFTFQRDNERWRLTSFEN